MGSHRYVAGGFVNQSRCRIAPAYSWRPRDANLVTITEGRLKPLLDQRVVLPGKEHAPTIAIVAARAIAKPGSKADEHCVMCSRRWASDAPAMCDRSAGV